MENSAYLALPLFAGLAAGDIPAALAALDALCRPFAKGETLLEAGQRGAPMGVVLAAGCSSSISTCGATARCWAAPPRASFLPRLTPFCPTSRCWSA